MSAHKLSSSKEKCHSNVSMVSCWKSPTLGASKVRGHLKLKNICATTNRTDSFASQMDSVSLGDASWTRVESVDNTCSSVMTPHTPAENLKLQQPSGLSKTHLLPMPVSCPGFPHLPGAEALLGTGSGALQVHKKEIFFSKST